MASKTNPYIENYELVQTHCFKRAATGDIIETQCARAIANAWHDGQSSAFYSFTSTGHFNRDDMLSEIEHCLRPRTVVRGSMKELFELNMLKDYIQRRPR